MGSQSAFELSGDWGWGWGWKNKEWRNPSNIPHSNSPKPPTIRKSKGFSSSEKRERWPVRSDFSVGSGGVRMVEGGVRIKPWEPFAPQSCAKLRKEVRASVPSLARQWLWAALGPLAGVWLQVSSSLWLKVMTEGLDWDPLVANISCPWGMNVLILKEELCGTTGHPL